MTTTTNAPNGRATRKSLADQIDRLDTILDGLADGLGEAVVTAVRGAVEVAVREAVRGVLTEVVTNPEVLDRLRTHLVPSAPAPAEMPAPQTERRANRLWAWMSARVRAAGRLVTAAVDRLRGGVAAAGERLDAVRPYAKPLLVAASVGVVVGILAYLAGPWLSALGSAVGGFATTLMIQAGLWLKRTLGTLPGADA